MEKSRDPDQHNTVIDADLKHQQKLASLTDKFRFRSTKQQPAERGEKIISHNLKYSFPTALGSFLIWSFSLYRYLLYTYLKFLNFHFQNELKTGCLSLRLNLFLNLIYVGLFALLCCMRGWPPPPLLPYLLCCYTTGALPTFLAPCCYLCAPGYLV